MSTVVSYFFPYEKAVQESKTFEEETLNSSWISRQIAYLKKLQKDSGLVRQTFLVVLNVMILADRVFKEFPKTLGKVSFALLNCVGLLYLNTYIKELGKSLIDFFLACRLRSIPDIIYTAFKVIDSFYNLVLMAATCTVSIFSLIGFSKEWSSDIYKKWLNPNGIVSYFVWLGLFISDYYLMDRLITDLKAVTHTNKAKVSEVYCKILLDPLASVERTEDARLAVRVVRYLGTWSFENARKEVWLHTTEKVKEQQAKLDQTREHVLPDYKKIDSVMLEQLMKVIDDEYNQKIFDGMLSSLNGSFEFKKMTKKRDIAGCIGRAIRKLFPQSAIESSIDTLFSMYYWKTYYDYYKNSQKKTATA